MSTSKSKTRQGIFCEVLLLENDNNRTIDEEDESVQKPTDSSGKRIILNVFLALPLVKDAKGDIAVLANERSYPCLLYDLVERLRY
jgi:hypothetical protein